MRTQLPCACLAAAAGKRPPSMLADEEAVCNFSNELQDRSLAVAAQYEGTNCKTAP